MRHWLSLVCLVALLLYVGWVLDFHQRRPAQPVIGQIASLERAMGKVAGTLNRATFLLVAPIVDPAIPGRLQERMGWAKAAPAGEVREARLNTDKGMYYLSVRWQMSGASAAHWKANYTVLTKALAAEGIANPVHVELEAKARGLVSDLLALTQSALDAVDAAQRQPWIDDRTDPPESASVAGWSQQLPQGPHSVNIQVAARRTAEGVRVWAAWPAISGDY